MPDLRRQARLAAQRRLREAESSPEGAVFPPPPTTEWYGKVETKARHRPEWPESGGVSSATTEGKWSQLPSVNDALASYRTRIAAAELQYGRDKIPAAIRKAFREEFKRLRRERTTLQDKAPQEEGEPGVRKRKQADRRDWFGR